MIPGPERNAHEREVALDRRLGNRPQRTVAAGDAEDIRRIGLPCECPGILAGLQLARLEPTSACGLGKLAGIRSGATRTRIDQEKPGQTRPSV